MQSPIKSFDQAVQAIAALEKRGWRLGLDRMLDFVHRAGLASTLAPPTGPNYIHVAGTNGKGSVTAYLQKILQGQGHRAGAFFSPFVFDVRERVQGPDGMISRADFAALTAKLMPVADSMVDTEFGGPTEFEFKTAMGLAYWQGEQCDWVALEVGLGGRLDATNVVTPAATVITSIGLDHTHILGDTLAAIATEKAGIIKPGIPVVVGVMSDEPRSTIHSIARDLDCPICQLGEQFSLEYVGDSYVIRSQFGELGPYTPGMAGAMQAENMAVAIIAAIVGGAVIDPSEIASSVASTRAPGRFQQIQYRGRTIVLDGAHNVDAGENLAKSLRAHGFDKVVLITNMLDGHEPEDFYAPLLPLAVSAHVAPIDFPRARPVEQVSAVLERGGCPASGHVGVLSALDAAIADAREHPGAPIVVTGSFYLVGEVGRAIIESEPTIDLES